ncbi:MAG: hypothetical protein JW839_13670 [Candidatus Lokiarchaeota archaeon]|nr:hypothetical protein [Candidatus Lokiarchaeota archaeon]
MRFKTAWGLAKQVGQEIFLESQLDSAGSQRARIIDRYAENMDAARHQSTTVKFTTAFMLGYLAILPAMALWQIKGIPVTAATAPTILFVASISLSLYHGMALFFTLFLKMMTMTSLATGNAFKVLGLLPLSRREVATIAYATSIRMNVVESLVFTFTMPLIALLINGSWTFFLANVATCALVISFANSLVVVLSNAIGRAMARAGTGSRIATFLRLITTAAYVAGFLLAFILMMYGMTSIEGLLLAGEATTEQLNASLPGIPFPFAGAYVASLTLVAPGTIEPAVVAMATAGFLALLGIVAVTTLASRNVLQHIGRDEPVARTAKPTSANTIRVEITARTPIKALIAQEFTTITREYGNLITFMLAVAMPVVFFVMSMASEPIENAGWASGVMYLGFQVYMVHAAVSAGEDKLGGTIAALPVRPSDVFNARRFAMYLNQFLSTGISMGIVLFLASDPWPILASQTVLLSFALVSVPLFLLIYARAFCRVNGRATMFPATMSNKTGKLIGIIVLIYAIAFIEVFLVEINSKGYANMVTVLIADFAGFMNGKEMATTGTTAMAITAVWIVNASIAAVLELVALRAFNMKRCSNST